MIALSIYLYNNVETKNINSEFTKQKEQKCIIIVVRILIFLCKIYTIKIFKFP